MTENRFWTFESTVTDPAGTTTTVTIRVPVEVASPDVRELGEVASMGANYTAGYVAKSHARYDEKAPF